MAAAETLRYNKKWFRILLAYGALGLFGGVNAYTSAREENPLTYWVIVGGMLTTFVLAVAWMRSLRLTIDDEGIRSQSIFGSQQMRWDEVEIFRFDVASGALNTKMYTFKLTDCNGKKLKCGGQYERPHGLLDKLIDYTYTPLYEKLAKQYNAGAEIDFGSIRLSRDAGVRVRRATIGWADIPLDSVADYKISGGHFRIWEKGKKIAYSNMLYHVHNAYVLLGFLDSLFGRTESQD